METRSNLDPYSSRPTTGTTTEISVWHVAVSPDDVKVMTLEQLDDAFRLDVIDTSTPVWKNGMSTWSPLGLVAGIEDETTTTTVQNEPHALWPPPAWPPAKTAASVNVVSIQPSASRSPAPPVLRPTVAPSGPKRQAPVSQPARPAPAAPSTRPAPPSSRAAAVTAPMPVQITAPFAMPASVPPTAFSVAPVAYFPPRRSSAVGVWLVTLASIAGIVLTLYRNDVFLRAARTAHREADYLRIERALVGGPSFGTLRSIDTLRMLRDKLASITNSAPPAPVVTTAAVPTNADTHGTPPKDDAMPATAEVRSPASASHAVDLGSLPLESAAPAPANRPEPPKSTPKPATPVAKTAAPVAPASRPKERAEKPVPVESAPSDSLKAAMTTGHGTAAKSHADNKEASADTPAPAPKESPPKTGGDAPRTGSGGLDLKSAIGDAVRRHPPKKRPKGSEYDPLNGDL